MNLKTLYSSFCINGLPEGCKYCIKGGKSVLFISGVCKRNCYYCSLSNKRKNKDITYANEKRIKNAKELIEEAIESNATSAGITGGDPFLFMHRTLKYARALKQRFGKKFHIHIYLPTQNITENKLKWISKYIDEVRFHPEIANFVSLDTKNSKFTDESVITEIEKIKLALLFWKKENIGIELPMIPEKKQEIFDFILKIKDYIGFVNLNELEISETNFNYMTNHYKFNETGYVIESSKPAGLWLLEQLKKQKIKLKVHFCTADLKNNHQFKNRLLKHEILPHGRRTKDGTVLYLITKYQNKNQLNKIIKDLVNPHQQMSRLPQYYIDKEKQRVILSNSLANKLLTKKHRVFLVEEFPTYDRIEVETRRL